MTTPVMRYVASTKNGRGPLVAMQQDLPKMIVHKTAAMPVEYGVKGSELMKVLRKGAEKFIRAMELRGLTLIPLPEGNPLVVTDETGKPYGTYSVTHDLDRAQPDALVDEKTGGRGQNTFMQPRSLEDSRGMVDYRIVGVFWAPQVSVEIAVTREKLRAQERAAKNPTQFAVQGRAEERDRGSGLVIAKH